MVMGQVFSSTELYSGPLLALYTHKHLLDHPGHAPPSLSTCLSPGGCDSHAPGSPGLIASLVSPAAQVQGSGHILPGLSSPSSESQALRGSFLEEHFSGQQCRCETG